MHPYLGRGARTMETSLGEPKADGGDAKVWREKQDRIAGNFASNFLSTRMPEQKGPGGVSK